MIVILLAVVALLVLLIGRNGGFTNLRAAMSQEGGRTTLASIDKRILVAFVLVLLLILVGMVFLLRGVSIMPAPT